MAITAVADVLALTTAVDTDVQPASGEIWLLKHIGHNGASGGTNLARWRTGLWDGTDAGESIYHQMHGNGPTHHVGISPGGAQNANGDIFASPTTNMAVILTNTVRMRTRFGDSTGAGAIISYAGVKL